MRMQTENKNWYWENTHGSRLTRRGSKVRLQGALASYKAQLIPPLLCLSAVASAYSEATEALGTADLSQHAGQRDGLTLKISSTSLWSRHSDLVWSIFIISVSICCQLVCKGSGKWSRRWGGYRGEVESKNEREGSERRIKYKTIGFFWSTLNPNILVHLKIQSCSHTPLCIYLASRTYSCSLNVADGL